MNIELGKYQHYKGKEYEVIGEARDSDNLKELVVYKGLYDSTEFGNNPLWVRAKTDFTKEVEVDGVKQPRFKKIT